MSGGWLQDHWQAARLKRRNAAWGSLPEDVLDLLRRPSVVVSEADIAFLVDVADEGMRSVSESRAAIRLLGGIVEDGFAQREAVLPHLLRLLNSRYPEVRTAATEAIWQVGDGADAPALMVASERETNPHVRVTMEHVLRQIAGSCEAVSGECMFTITTLSSYSDG